MFGRTASRGQRRVSQGGLAFVAALALGLPACGGGGGSNSVTNNTPPPAQRTRSTIGTGNWQLGSLAEASAVGLAKDFYVVTFTTGATGDVEALVEWTSGANDVDIAIGRGDCSINGVLGGRCTTVVDSTSFTAKPERITATGLAAGNYALVIINEGPGRESGTFQLFITR